MNKSIFLILVMLLLVLGVVYAQGSFIIANITNTSKTYFIVNGTTGKIGVGMAMPPAKLSVLGTFSANATNDTIGTANPTGWFSDYNLSGASRIDFSSGTVGDASSSFRDALYVQHASNDTSIHNIQHVNYGGRFAVFGPYSAGNYLAATTDNVAIDGTAIANITNTSRGVSGITTSAIQYGVGIASNEFSVSNPAAASAQSESMAAVQAILSPKKAASDGTHFYWGTYVNNVGKKATAAFAAASAGTDGDNGQFQYLLYAASANISDAAIKMPLSTTGDVGTIIEYDTNDWTDFIRSTNTYRWISDGTVRLIVDGSGNVGVGTTSPAHRLEINESLKALNVSNVLFVNGTKVGIGIAPNGGTDRLLQVVGSGQIAYFGSTKAAIMIQDSNSILDIVGINYSNNGFNPLQFRTAANPSIYLDTSGTVGIGTTAPAYLLQVANASKAVNLSGILYINGSSGNVGIGTAGPSSLFHVHSTTNYGGQMKFSNTNADSSWIVGVQGSAGASEFIVYDYDLSETRLLVGDTGNVGIGVTNPAKTLTVNGQFNLTTTGSDVNTPAIILDRNGGGTVWGISLDSGSFRIHCLNTANCAGNTIASLDTSVTGWAFLSDLRMKENVETLSVLDKLANYRAVSFEWKSSGLHDIGVIAQEVNQVFPEVVDSSGGENGTDMWGVKYDRLGFLALQGVKELKEEKDSEISQLKRENDLLRSRIEILEGKIE